MDFPGTVSYIFIHWLPTKQELDVTTSALLALIFIGASFVVVPRTFLCIAAGGLFGQSVTLIILPSTIVGGIFAFVVARSILSKPARRFIEARPLLWRVAKAVDDEGWRLLALLRFASPIPNAIQNYLFALTKIDLVSYAIVSLIFTTPQIVLYVYLGAEGRSMLLDKNLSSISRIVLFLGCVLMSMALLLICRNLWRGKSMALQSTNNSR